ncbi:hypothetical protein M3Y99_01585300 [Aphelenchoides fujianensis]|nr:hypothetical protein M3Y99_01585300 [Aphelenchoides fujianensis]
MSPNKDVAGCVLLLLTVVQCGMAAVTLPPKHGQFDYQIGGPYEPQAGVKIVSRDMSVAPLPNVYSICYINAFQTQPGDKAFWTKEHPTLLLKSGGQLVEDPEWKGEYILDTRTAENRAAIADIVGKWIDECAEKGFQAIEPDNLDSYTRSKKLITKQNNLDYAKLLAARAHAKNLAFAQKNDATVTKAQATTVGFDFGIVEECQEWKECGKFDAIYGDQWIEIEYTDVDDADALFEAACQARGSRISLIQRDRDVVTPSNKEEYVYKLCPSS